LQCVAVCCSVLQCVAVRCDVYGLWRGCVERCPYATCDVWEGSVKSVYNIQYTGVLQCVAVCCGVLQCVAVCCSVLQCVVIWNKTYQMSLLCAKETWVMTHAQRMYSRVTRHHICVNVSHKWMIMLHSPYSFMCVTHSPYSFMCVTQSPDSYMCVTHSPYPCMCVTHSPDPFMCDTHSTDACMCVAHSHTHACVWRIRTHVMTHSPDSFMCVTRSLDPLICVTHSTDVYMCVAHLSYSCMCVAHSTYSFMCVTHSPYTFIHVCDASHDTFIRHNSVQWDMTHNASTHACVWRIYHTHSCVWHKSWHMHDALIRLRHTATLCNTINSIIRVPYNSRATQMQHTTTHCDTLRHTTQVMTHARRVDTSRLVPLRHASWHIHHTDS